MSQTLVEASTGKAQNRDATTIVLAFSSIRNYDDDDDNIDMSTVCQTTSSSTTTMPTAIAI